MNEQLNFVSQGFLVYDYFLLISRYKFQEPQMLQAVLALLIFDRSVWWVHYTWDVEEHLVSSQFFIKQNHLQVLQHTYIQQWHGRLNRELRTDQHFYQQNRCILPYTPFLSRYTENKSKHDAVLEWRTRTFSYSAFHFHQCKSRFQVLIA